MTNNIETSYGERKCVVRTEKRHIFEYDQKATSLPFHHLTFESEEKGSWPHDRKNKGKGTNQTSEVKIEREKPT